MTHQIIISVHIFRDLQECPAIPAPLACPVSKEWRVWKGPKVTKESPDRKDLEGRKATAVKWACPASLASTVSPVSKALPDLQA